MGEEMGEEGGGEEGTHFYKHNHDTNAKDREDATDAKDADEDGGEGIKGLARKLWMGDEKPGWQGRRLKKEKEELEKGVGYGGIIMGQVREVFGGREDGEGEGGKREG